MPIGDSVWVRARAASSNGTVSFVSGMVPSRFGDEYIKAGGNCHRPTVWHERSEVIVHARFSRGPGLESRSGHLLFPLL